jgi:hypothetical protein
MSLNELERFERKVHSQNGEDGVIEAIFSEIGVTNRYFVEFGCHEAEECNAALLLEQGWQGLLMDGGGVSKNPRAVVRKEFIRAENINNLFRKYEVPQAFDLLSIDIDGNDYWVWRAITPYRPRVVIIEYNAHFPPSESRVIIYDPKFMWTATDYFGGSLRAMKELGEEKRYTLVYCEGTGANAFFIANEALPTGFRPRPIEQLYRPPNYLNENFGWPRDPHRTMIDPALMCVFSGFEIKVGL